MSDVVLSNKFQKIFEKLKDQELDCHLDILNYLWDHWDELSDKQVAYVTGQNISRSRHPHSSVYYSDFIHSFSNVFPEEIHEMMIDIRSTQSVNELLWTHRKYRKKPVKGSKRMTRSELVKRYYVEVMGIFHLEAII